MEKKVKEPKKNLQLLYNEFVLGAFIVFFIGALSYLFSLYEGIKTYDEIFSSLLYGSGIILMSTSVFVIILSLIYSKIKGRITVENKVRLDSNLITAVCPKCNNKFSAEPKKIDDFIVIECSHCGIKLKKVDNN
ncbi:hypothetical protein AYK24_03655 [Thermoplasmatales archaeon SG8-52-4]|nr:MAG: hypothetical protein AYK24_03655 [Thermoplasmatales archaeon SG8-52-4]